MIYIALATIFYSAFLIINTIAARVIDPVFAAAIVTGVSAIIPIVVAVRAQSQTLTPAQGVWAAVAAGFCIALYSIFLNRSFTTEKVGVVVPIVYGGSLVITTLLSLVVFRERIGTLQAIGLVVMMIGIGIVIYARIAAGR